MHKFRITGKQTLSVHTRIFVFVDLQYFIIIFDWTTLLLIHVDSTVRIVDS